MNQIAPTPPTAAPDTACPSCGAANRGGTRFCSACGTALTAAAPNPLPPPQPVPPAPPFQPGRNFVNGPAGGFGQIPTDKHADVALPADQAYARAQQALIDMKADITAPNLPAGLMAIIPTKGFGNPVRFRCQVMVQPTGPASSRVAFGIKVDWNSTFMVLGIIGAIAIFNMMFLTASVGLLAPLFSIAAVGWVAYDFATGIPNKLAKQFGNRLTSGATQAAPQATPQPAAAPQPVYQPEPQPAPQPAADQPAAASEEADIIAKIEKLAALRDKGLLSAEEFEKRRADLLDRL